MAAVVSLSLGHKAPDRTHSTIVVISSSFNFPSGGIFSLLSLY